jgi:threonyl-tRNA synthetase
MEDHREIGRALDLFMFSDLSPGCPIWLPKGTNVYNLLLDRIRRLNEDNGYTEVRTPILWKSKLYETSGHLVHYAENMFFVGEGENCLKPMNCPGHMEIFRSKHWSYRDLPVRFAEYGPLHRNETSGAIGGLTRCRAFCQDDAHIFCSQENLQEEIKTILKMIECVYGNWFGMKYRPVLSTRPDGFLGEVETWDKAEASLEDAIKSSGLLHEVAPKEGAFYGPKIDFIVTDSLGREWQTATIQLDFQLPQRFGCNYTDKDNQEKTPIVIHRAIYGSFERFIGILLEHTQGHLPSWLAPTSVKILPISEKIIDYAKEVESKLLDLKIRCELDDSNNPITQKIAVGHINKIPFLAILGAKEKQSRSVTLKNLKDNKQETMPLEAFLSKIVEKE